MVQKLSSIPHDYEDIDARSQFPVQKHFSVPQVKTLLFLSIVRNIYPKLNEIWYFTNFEGVESKIVIDNRTIDFNQWAVADQSKLFLRKEKVYFIELLLEEIDKLHIHILQSHSPLLTETKT